MPKTYINGIIREMTTEEIIELEQLSTQFPVEETIEEKLEKIKQLYSEIEAMLQQGGNNK